MNSLARQEDHLPAITTVVPENIAVDCADFFGLHKMPFSLKPRQVHIYEHSAYSQVKNTLLFAITANEKLVKITGDSGSGKTLLINQVLSGIDQEYHPIVIRNPKISPQYLLRQIIDEFGQPYPVDASVEQLMRALHFILHAHYTNTDSGVIVWIDDAQHLSLNTLLIIDKICNWETPNRNLIQFILSGNEELDKTLDHSTLVSLKRKIRFSDKLHTIKKSEVEEYLHSYLQVYNSNDAPQFSSGAISKIHKYVAGNPSGINELAYKSILLAYGKGSRKISGKLVDLAQEDSYVPAKKSNKRVVLGLLSAWIIINIAFLTLVFSGVDI